MQSDVLGQWPFLSSPGFSDRADRVQRLVSQAEPGIRWRSGNLEMPLTSVLGIKRSTGTFRGTSDDGCYGDVRPVSPSSCPRKPLSCSRNISRPAPTRWRLLFSNPLEIQSNRLAC